MKVDIYVKTSEIPDGRAKISISMSSEQFQNLLDAVNNKRFVSVQTDFQVDCINTDTILRITAIKEWE